MSTSQTRFIAARHAAAAFLLPAFFLVGSAVAPAAAEEGAAANTTAQTTSSTTGQGRGNTQSTARTATGAARSDTPNSGTQTQTTPVITNETLATAANQRMSNETRPTAEARAAAEDERRVDPSDGVTTAAERRALERSLGSMDARLDQLLTTMNTATGADRAEAMAVVIQELVTQVAQLRRILLGTAVDALSEVGALDAATADQQAVFITPSSVAQAEERRQRGLSDGGGTTAGSRGTTSRLEAPSGTSSLSAQAESRRRGELSEPTTADAPTLDD